MTFVTASWTYEAFCSGSWVDITADVIRNPVTWSYGVTGDGPTDVVASTGTLTFMLRDDAHDGKLVGRYSMAHTNCLLGWRYGIPFRLRGVYSASLFPRFYGTIYHIVPDTGSKGRRQVTVTVYDCMRLLAEADVRAVPLQVNKSESEIIIAVINSLPAASQPLLLDLNLGVDTIPYALDNLGAGTKTLSVVSDVAVSSAYFVASTGDGTLIGRTRHTLTTRTSSISFNEDFLELEVSSDLQGVYNLVNVTYHPKNVDPSPTTVLYSYTGTAPYIPPGDTVTLFGTFNDPTTAQRLIGGLNVVTALVAYPTAGYDYAGNSAIDGTGADMTANISIVATASATTVQFDITNNAAIPVYLIPTGGTAPALRIRGEGVYDRGAPVAQSYSPQFYGTRPITIDLPTQGDPLVAQSYAEWVQTIYSGIVVRPLKITFVANESNAKMLFALTVEPSLVITITESMSGITSMLVRVQSVSLTVTENFITCTLTLAPTSNIVFWLWGIVGQSEWGQTTRYGF